MLGVRPIAGKQYGRFSYNISGSMEEEHKTTKRHFIQNNFDMKLEIEPIRWYGKEIRTKLYKNCRKTFGLHLFSLYSCKKFVCVAHGWELLLDIINEGFIKCLVGLSKFSRNVLHFLYVEKTQVIGP